jgi:thiamine pyrophosphokinase
MAQQPEQQQQRTVVVFTGGDVPPEWAAVLVPRSAVVVAADGGVDHALAVGVMPSVVVGDFDSISPAGMAAVVAAGAEIHRHDAAKDHTDLELALQLAMGMEPAEVVVIGGGGGRLDHVLANAAVLASPVLAAVDVVAHLGNAVVHVVRAGRPCVVNATPGTILTLLALGATATGVTTTGLRFALNGDDLHPWSARGVSNECVAVSATVEIATGVVLAVVPDSAKPPMVEQMEDTT